jgi:hypothetical protein
MSLFYKNKVTNIENIAGIAENWKQNEQEIDNSGKI